MNTLLSIANGALQYHRGRQTGVSGIMGIVVALLVVFQWKHIYPVLKAWGIVDFFKRLGLVYDEPYLTGFAIFMFIFRITIVLSVLIIILLALFILLSMIFSNEKIALYVILPIMSILMTPFIILYFLFRMIFRRKQWKEERARALEEKEKERKLGTPLEQLLRDHSEEITREQALLRLNRIPTLGDHELFLLGVTADDKLYVLFPRPLSYEIYGGYQKGDLAGYQFTVEKYDKVKHKPQYIGQYVPKKFLIKEVIKELVVIQADQQLKYYKTNSEDMLTEMRWVRGFKEYVEKTQNDYFTRKKTILKNLKNATEKTVVDNFIHLLAMFDAPNEDIVKMMRDNESVMEGKMDF